MSTEVLVQIWVAVSAAGFFLSLILSIESWRDIVALGPRTNGRRWTALSRFAREGLRVTVHWAWMLLGLSVLLDISLGSKVILALLFGNVALVVNSVIDARTRTLIYRTRSHEPDIHKP